MLPADLSPDATSVNDADARVDIRAGAIGVVVARILAEHPELAALPFVTASIAVSELQRADNETAFAPVLIITGPSLTAPIGTPCEWCCHWELPLYPPYRGRPTEHGVGLRFAEWLTYDFHVRAHQGIGEQGARWQS